MIFKEIHFYHTLEESFIVQRNVIQLKFSTRVIKRKCVLQIKMYFKQVPNIIVKYKDVRSWYVRKYLQLIKSIL